MDSAEKQNPLLKPKPSCAIFNYDSHLKHIGDFTHILNQAWGKFSPFFPIKERQLAEMLDFDPLFIIAFHNEEPAGILRTISGKFNEPEYNDVDYRQKAAYVCSQIRPFSELTHDGKFGPYKSGSNVNVFVDITVAEKFREKNYPGSQVFSGMTDFAKLLLSKRPEDRTEQLKYLPSPERLEQLARLNYAVTFTPNLDPIKNSHIKQNAFDTNIVLKNARPDYALPDVNFMCYMAPGFMAEMGQKS